MQDKIIFKFDNGTDTLVLDDSLFSVSDYSGLEASDVELNTDKNINTDGEHLKRKRVLPREIVIKFDAVSGDTSETRQMLISFFSPYKDGVLTVDYMDVTRHIPYMVRGFKISTRNVYERISAMVTLKCLDPDFLTDQIDEDIITLVGGWKWKFSLPFSLKQFGSLEKNIVNAGDKETPVEIFFHGPATNPKVTLNGDQYIRLKKSITADETLHINTGFRQKTVEIQSNSGVEDAWDYLDMTSDFFWLGVGDNVITYSSEGITSASSVTISYKERHAGI